MTPDYYHEQLTASANASADSGPGGRDAEPTDGRGLAAVLHLALMLGGPLGAMLSLVLTFLGGLGLRPLVQATARAVVRFVLQLLLLLVGGLALVLTTDHENWGLALVVPALLAWLCLPPWAAWRTLRTGRVFRYPVWDLLPR